MRRVPGPRRAAVLACFPPPTCCGCLHSDAAVDAMSFGYTMGENAGNVAGQLAAEQVRTELVRVAAAANASIREVAQDLAASQAASEVRVTESVDAVSRTVAELRRELQDEAGQLPINSALGCTTSAPGQLRFNNASQSVEVCSSGAWVSSAWRRCASAARAT